MTKLSFNYFLLLSCLLACEERTLDTHGPAPEEPIVFKEVNADVSDIEVAREYSFDIHVNGTFDYQENYYYSFNEGFDLTFPFYKASYEAGSMPVISPRVHNSLMCRTNECDSSEMMGSGVWYRYGVKPAQPSFVWKFITTDTWNGYEVVMNELPNQVKIVGTIESLSTTSDNIIEFEYNGTDSLLFGLLVIPKINLASVTDPAWISTQHHFPITSKDNRFVIPAESVEKVSLNSTDTAFINLISLKRVVKVIEGKKLAINYRRNHIYPTLIK
jgi:hypothetical protein